MTPIFLYGEVDLPPIPSKFLLNTDSYPVEKYVVDIGYGKDFKKNKIAQKNSAYAKYIVDDESLISWIKETVPPWPSNENLTIQKVIPNGSDKDTIFPVHHDVRRMFALNYILKTGGDSVTTSWFKDVNQPLVRSLKKEIGMQSDTGPVEYNDVELLSSVQCQLGKWYLIRTNVLHDVDHVDFERSAITIPYFDETIITEFKQKGLFRNFYEIPNT